VTFGISFGVTALAVAWIAGFLDLRRRAGWLLLGSLGVASALEVAWVTLQAWRSVPSHFAREGVDEALFIAAGLSIAVVGVALVVVTVLAFRRLVAPPSMAPWWRPAPCRRSPAGAPSTSPCWARSWRWRVSRSWWRLFAVALVTSSEPFPRNVLK
jgi:hypothetical protein